MEKLVQKIKTQVHEFFDDVYGDDSRIVKIDHDQVSVEQKQQSIIRLYYWITENISDICRGFKNQFEKMES